jgi:hypothetical protein
LIKKDRFSALPLRQRREIVQAELQRIYSYQRWHDVLDALALNPLRSGFHAIVAAAMSVHGEEIDRHRTLKEFVANNPEIVGLSASTAAGNTEFPLPSGDRLDVSFAKQRIWVAAEVKSLVSSDADIARGLFQCVKYLAVMEAVLIAEERPQSARLSRARRGASPATYSAQEPTRG